MDNTSGLDEAATRSFASMAALYIVLLCIATKNYFVIRRRNSVVEDMP